METIPTTTVLRMRAPFGNDNGSNGNEIAPGIGNSAYSSPDNSVACIYTTLYYDSTAPIRCRVYGCNLNKVAYMTEGIFNQASTPVVNSVDI